MRRLLPFCIAFGFLIGTAVAIDEPVLKEGLWSIHTVTTDQPGNKKTEGTRSICRSHASDQHAKELAKKAAEKCKTSTETTSDGMVTESECTVAGTVLKTKGKVTMTGDSSAHSETHTTYSPAMYGVSESTMVMDQKYVGACPAGVEPGDIIGPDGKVVHRSKL